MHAAIVFLPLVGAIAAGLFGRWLGDKLAPIVTCVLLVASAILSWIVFFDVAIEGHVRTIELMSWIDVGAFEVNWSIMVDQLTAVMLVVVTTVSSVVHVYSIGYMSHDPHRPRFFAYLSLFTFSMLMLVTADNFVQMFFGWEGVGVCSYLLIGFWYKKPSANAAAIKAFVVNRVGDFGFALGIMGVFMVFKAVTFEAVFDATPDVAGQSFSFLGMNLDIMTTLCLLLFVGAMGKSAQMPLHTWLPDAMEGPTPVSALIHAATMVTAGVFMVVRLSPMFEQAPDAMIVVAFVGATTCFFAATVGICQNDIKRVIAYSTCSQLGYMFFACGVGAYPVAIFHLFTHAFFKALLFLGSGQVIHAVDGEQDMRRMGGLWKKLPITYAYMWIGSLALAGIPIFAGYWSKDLIIESAFVSDSPMGGYAFWLGVGAAFLTALYSWRLIIMTFHGRPRMSEHAFGHAHEAPRVMWVPLLVLAAGALLGGLPFLGGIMVYHGGHEFFGHSITILGENVIELAHEATPFWVKALVLVVAASGVAAAYIGYMWKPQIPGLLASNFRPLYKFLLNKWYFDELYDWLFVRPAMRLGHGLWKVGDGAVIDGLGPDGLAAATLNIARRARAMQSGYLYHYAFAMLIGVAVIVSWFLFRAWG
ncbi:MAG: NADH-quinone oxidoreductase subunit L [Proteobacteria bacterium]|nr:NADH-quinone oxidoreductase subunit L [Pseudomonadota bacterium]MDA1071829.1 NADH-quinone oxidoreductase subunit L [Pseudomonadota bacterium]